MYPDRVLGFVFPKLSHDRHGKRQIFFFFLAPSATLGFHPTNGRIFRKYLGVIVTLKLRPST